MPLIFGETASGLMVPLLLESDGSLPQVGKGWIGAAWQKDPLQLGYSGDKSEQIADTNADAGANTLAGAAVPAGELWVVEAICAANQNKANIRMQLYVSVNGVVVYLADATGVAAYQFVTWSGAITLAEGDQVKAIILGCDAGDDILLNYHARRIDIDQ